MPGGSKGPGLLKGIGLAVKAARENTTALATAVDKYKKDARLDEVLSSFSDDTTSPLDDKIEEIILVALGDLRDNALLAADLLSRLSSSMEAIGRIIDDLGHRPLREVLEAQKT